MSVVCRAIEDVVAEAEARRLASSKFSSGRMERFECGRGGGVGGGWTGAATPMRGAAAAGAAAAATAAAEAAVAAAEAARRGGEVGAAEIQISFPHKVLVPVVGRLCFAFLINPSFSLG